MILALVMAGAGLAGVPADPPIEVTVRRLADDRWQADYRLAEPVAAVRFVRTPAFRQEEWTVVGPGLSLERVGDADLVIGEEAFDRLTITLPTNTTSMVRDYELVDRFTDGSVILYSGHFDVHPVTTDPDRGWAGAARLRPGQRPPVAYRFVPQAAESVHVPGGGDRYVSTGSGVYVYFGDIEPVASDHVDAFVDPGLPADLREAFDRHLPRLFALYERRFGQALTVRPTVYLGAVPGGTGYSTRGGVTGGVVQLAVEADFANPPPQLAERLVHLIAHESAHLWNGGRFHHRQLAGSYWLHEGSADALAERALAEIGYYDAEDLASIASQQATLCARSLTAGRLIDAPAGGRFTPMYTCGAVIGLITERAWPDGDLFDFWARLFALARDDGEYTVADYLGLAWQLAGSRTADTLYRLIHEELADPFELLRSAFVDLGLEATVAPGAAGDDQAASSRALSWLVGQDCQGGYSIFTEGDALRIAGLPRCTLFTADRSFPVTRVEGHSIHSGRAVDAVIAERCGGELPVRLTLRDGSTLEVPCPEPWREERRAFHLAW